MVSGYGYSLRLSNKDIQYLTLDKKVTKAKLSRKADCSSFENMESLDEYEVRWWINESSIDNASIIDHYKSRAIEELAIMEKTPIYYRMKEIINSPSVKIFNNGLKKYLADGITIDQVNERNSTLLYYAVQQGKTDFVKIILENGADPNLIMRMEDETCFGTILNGPPNGAMKRIRDIEIVKLLVEHGADINSINSYGTTPIWYAQTVEIAEFLLKSGADICVKNKKGESLAQVNEKLLELNTDGPYVSRPVAYFLKDYFVKCK